MTNPIPEHRIAFANGLAHLLLKYATLPPEEKVLVERVRDARTIEELREIWYSHAYTSASGVISAPGASAHAHASVVYAYAYAVYACGQAIKAGVPEAQVRALRALTLGAV